MGGVNDHADIQNGIAELFIKHELSFHDGLVTLMSMIGRSMNENPNAPAQMEFEMGKFVILVSDNKDLLPHREEIDQHFGEGGTQQTKH